MAINMERFDFLISLPEKYQLLEFLKEYMEWVDAGGPDQEVFTQDHGLCSNLILWASRYGIMGWTIRLELKRALSRLKYGKTGFPFNDGIRENYFKLGEFSDTLPHHKNPKRIAWVKRTIKRLEKSKINRLIY